MKLIMKNRLHIHEIHRPRCKYKHKYNKYEKCHSAISNFCGSVHKKLSNTEADLKNVLIMKKRMCKVITHFLPILSFDYSPWNYQKTRKFPEVIMNSEILLKFSWLLKEILPRNVSNILNINYMCDKYTGMLY